MEKFHNNRWNLGLFKWLQEQQTKDKIIVIKEDENILLCCSKNKKIVFKKNLWLPRGFFSKKSR